MWGRYGFITVISSGGGVGVRLIDDLTQRYSHENVSKTVNNYTLSVEYYV